MRLNLGCGAQVPYGWINVDYALGARFARVPFFRALNRKLRLFDFDWDERIYIQDLSEQFPWPDNTIDIVYSSHLLEHFTREDGRRFIAECHRVLRNDGILRIVVPDLRHIVVEYFEGRIPADDFVESLGVLCGNNKNALKDRLAPFIQFPHKCMYDASRLLGILRKAGFDAATRDPFESEISDIRNIELKGRTKDALIVEATKR